MSVRFFCFLFANQPPLPAHTTTTTIPSALCGSCRLSLRCPGPREPSRCSPPGRELCRGCSPAGRRRDAPRRRGGRWGLPWALSFCLPPAKPNPPPCPPKAGPGDGRQSARQDSEGAAGKGCCPPGCAAPGQGRSRQAPSRHHGQGRTGSARDKHIAPCFRMPGEGGVGKSHRRDGRLPAALSPRHPPPLTGRGPVAAAAPPDPPAQQGRARGRDVRGL